MMTADFFIAILTGWSILLIFWIITVLFLFIRNPQKLRIIKKANFRIILVFLIGYFIIFLFY